MSPFRHRSSTLCLLALTLLLVLARAAVAQSGSGYALSWWIVDGGGGVSLGGDFVLSGSAGQPDAGVLSNGGLTLCGGFWCAVAPDGEYRAFLPLLIRCG